MSEEHGYQIALRLWIKRHGEAMAEIRRLNSMVNLLLSHMTDEQLAVANKAMAEVFGPPGEPESPDR